MTDPDDGLTYLCGGEIDAGTFSLSIVADALEPSELTRLLGIEPTSQHRRDDFNSSGKLQFNYGKWEFSTSRLDFRKGSSCEESFDAFMRSLPDLPEAWSLIAAKYEARVYIVLKMQTRNREFDLSAFALGELARRQLPIHIDTYLECDEEQ